MIVLVKLYIWESIDVNPNKIKNIEYMIKVFEETKIDVQNGISIEPERYGRGKNSFLESEGFCIALDKPMNYNEWMKSIGYWNNNNITKDFFKKFYQKGLDINCINRCLDTTKKTTCAIVINRPLDKINTIGFFGI